MANPNSRKGVERLLLRSVASEILREAERDVLVVPVPDDPEPSKQ